MKKFELTSVTSPSIEFECAGGVIQSDVIKDTKKNPNFEKPVLTRMIVVTILVFVCLTLMKSSGSSACLSSDKLSSLRNYACVVSYCITILFCNDKVHGETNVWHSRPYYNTSYEALKPSMRLMF